MMSDMAGEDEGYSDHRESSLGGDGDQGGELDDRGGFDAVPQDHSSYLYQKALHLTGNPEDAKDLVQDCLSRAFEKFDKFQPGTNMRAWLTKILTNLFLDGVKHQRVIDGSEADLIALGEWSCNSPLTQMPDSQLTAAVAALKPELQAVIECCYFHRMKYREAAAELGIPLGTVSTRLKQAIEQLRELLANSCGT
jgi:RNA polymerase sigma-70 factor (ECF subfamily)